MRLREGAFSFEVAYGYDRLGVRAGICMVMTGRCEGDVLQAIT